MYPTDLVAELDTLARALDAAGVRADTDPTRVPVPGAWVTVETMTPDRLGGEWSVTAAVYLLARDTGHTPAVADLTAMLATLAEVAPGVGEARPESVALPGFSGPLPSFYVTTPIGD